MVIVWTLLISSVAIWADVLLKAAANGKNYGLVLIGALLYFGQAIFWYEAYKIGKFSTVAVIYSVFTILLSVLIGAGLFHERVGAREVIGIIFGIIAVVILSK